MDLSDHGGRCPGCGAELAPGDDWCAACAAGPRCTSGEAASARDANDRQMSGRVLAPQRRRTRLALVIPAAWLMCLSAWVLLDWQTESVLATGPVLMVLGLVMFLRSFRAARFGPGMWLGGAHCAICVLFFLLVNLYGWSPADARGPFLYMGLAYTLLALPASVAVWVCRPAALPTSPWYCAKCGYLLLGLDQPRCPECGHWFDLEALKREPLPADVAVAASAELNSPRAPEVR